jgi:hypothetical protein
MKLKFSFANAGGWLLALALFGAPAAAQAPQIQQDTRASLAAWAEQTHSGYSELPAEQRAIVLMEMVARMVDASHDGSHIHTEQRQDFFHWPVDLQLSSMARNWPGGGTNCAGVATILTQVILELEPWPVWRLHMADGAASHTVVLVEAEPGRVIVLDAFFGHYVADARGTPLTISEIRSLLRQRRADRVNLRQPGRISREFWFPPGYPDEAGARCSPADLREYPNVRRCIFDNWSANSAYVSGYGASMSAFITSRSMPNDPRYMFLLPRQVDYSDTHANATPGAIAIVNALNAGG